MWLVYPLPHTPRRLSAYRRASLRNHRARDSNTPSQSLKLPQNPQRSNQWRYILRVANAFGPAHGIHRLANALRICLLLNNHRPLRRGCARQPGRYLGYRLIPARHRSTSAYSPNSHEQIDRSSIQSRCPKPPPCSPVLLVT
jgi:hypothetical protein